MDLLFPRLQRPRKYSVERLKECYSDLLRTIDTLQSNDNPDSFESNETEPDQATNFSFRSFFFKRNNSIKNTADAKKKKGHLDIAVRIMSATRSADKEGRTSQAVVFRDDESVAAMARAKLIERKVVSLIRCLGEVIVNSERATGDGSLRSDEAFEFFCEKAILAFLVDIVKAKPCQNSRFHGITWSPLVKAQVLHTISALVSSVREVSALYYLLSQHCISQLLETMQPLQQWTDPALEAMLKPYLSLLRNLTLQLGASPHLFALFAKDDDFALYTALLETTTSAVAQSNSSVHVTCLHLLVGLMQIDEEAIVDWVRRAEREHRILADHFYQLGRRRFRRLANLTTGPIVDPIRTKAVAVQLLGLDDELDAVNDILACAVRPLNHCLCEAILQLAHVQCHDLVPGPARQLLTVGVCDADVIPDREALAQVSCMVMQRWIRQMEYAPVVRMLAVATLFPRTLSQETAVQAATLTQGLNAIVQGKIEEGVVDNPHLPELMKALTGEYGEWRTVSSALFIENVLSSNALDSTTLRTLGILPNPGDPGPTRVELALGSFLRREHSLKSDVSILSFECVSSCAAHYLNQLILSVNASHEDVESRRKFVIESPVYLAVDEARRYFCRKTLAASTTPGLAEVFVDLFESVVETLYKRTSKGPRGSYVHTYSLSQHGGVAYGANSEVLIRKMRSITSNEVEETRFYARMSLQLRALCRIIDRLLCFSGSPLDSPELWTDPAGGLAKIFGVLRPRPLKGSDLDLRGRMAFSFSSECETTPEHHLNGRTCASTEDLQNPSRMAVILDPADMVIVKKRGDSNRGIVVCSIRLQDVIAAAADGDSLHVAVRHHDVGLLVRNGNLALHFENTGTCLVVQQYLDRCRQVLRRELLDNIVALLSEDLNGEAKTNDDEAVALPESSPRTSDDEAIAVPEESSPLTSDDEAVGVPRSSPQPSNDDVASVPEPSLQPTQLA